MSDGILTQLKKSATISADGVYRYTLSRVWDETLPNLNFIMLNPSTADADLDDPTIRRCIGFGQRDGYGGIQVVNLYAFRATKPSEMLAAIDPVGPDNDAAWLQINGDVVAAWGANAKQDQVNRAIGVFQELKCLGVTKDGHPRHPLYIRGDQPIIPWSAP